MSSILKTLRCPGKCTFLLKRFRAGAVEGGENLAISFNVIISLDVYKMLHFSVVSGL